MINYAQNFFGKSIKEINENDLIIFFTDAKNETNNIEYKSYPKSADWEKSLTKVLKTICSMLNGEGGMLIWGAPVGEKVEGSDEPIFMGSLTPIPVKKEQDWFINKISSSISPMPKDIAIGIVKVAGAWIYLFEVQESQYKPHQFEHTYFIRLDGQSKPAPHYIVQALMREIKFPDIRGVIGITDAQIDSGKLHLAIRIGIFNVSQLQNEFDINFKVLLVGGIFSNVQSPNPKYHYSMQGALVESKVIQQPLYYGMPYVASFPVTVHPTSDKLQLLLSFGGRQSPAKTSRYTLNLVDFNFNNIRLNIVEEIENEPFREKQSIDQILSDFKKPDFFNRIN